MVPFFGRLSNLLFNKINRQGNEDFREEKIIMDFSKTKKSPFDIKSESSYNAYLSKGSFQIGLKKPKSIAWTEIPDREYHDHIIEARIRLDSRDGYSAAGLTFHIRDEEAYYMALFSSKGYFRLDVVRDNSPKPLIAWTDIYEFDGKNINLGIITYGTFLIFLVNGKWVGETSDDSLNSGKVGFALASYDEKAKIKQADTTPADGTSEDENKENVYVCKAFLDYLSIDTRVKSIEEKYKKWTDNENINAESRLRLAETFAVMGESLKALEQINKAWERRDQAIRAVSSGEEAVRTKKELLLAARMSLRLGQFNEAGGFLDAILEQWADSAEGKEAVKEKIKILSELKKFGELKEFVLKYIKNKKDINYHTLLARCYFELKEYKKSAAAWDKAFEMNNKNGIYATNAANAYELSGKKEEALSRFIKAGKIFINQDNQAELGVIMPKISILGGNNWEARVLAGKWAYSIEDYNRCITEFTAANKIRCSIKPRPEADPAHYYLWGLALNLQGKNSDAVRLIEKAVRLAPDYGLFRFKLAEIKLASGVKESNLAEEFKLALKTMDDPDGKMAEHAGNLLRKAGNAKGAKYFLGKAGKDAG
jgi:tetratricopeptide (TPR) repeat protein